MRSFHSLALVLLVAAGLLSAGCEEGVNPFTNTDRYFSVYGYLDPAADTQFVRVVPLRQRIEVPAPGPLDVQVTVEDLETGTTYPLRDSLVTFADGSYGHVFYALFEPIHDHAYRLTVRRPDGPTTTAETTVPPFAYAEVGAPVAQGGATTQRIRWYGIDYVPHRVEAWYRLGGSGPREPFQDIPVVYPPGRLGGVQGDAWEVLVFLEADRDSIFEMLGFSSGTDFPYPLYNVGMRITEPDAAWRPPGGVWDPEVLAQPGVFSNVENGFGFFGAVSEPTVEWTLSPEITRRIGFPYPR